MVYKTSVCRCCLSDVDLQPELYEFSSEVSIDEEVNVRPKNFVKIQDVWRNVIFPNADDDDFEDVSRICSQCLGDLKFCFLFRKKCLDSAPTFSEYADDIFELVKEDEPIKIENTDEHVSEYVLEEFIDEDTNDGFESEHGMIQDDDLESAEQTLKSIEISTSPPQQRSPYKKRSLKKIKIEEDEEDTEQCYKCKKCDARFTSKAEARGHLQQSHSNDDKSFNCLTCTKVFKNRYQLVLHNRSHTGEKPFACPVCNRSFSMSSNLQKHLDTHSTEKNYLCTFCNQLFKTQRSLKFHTVCYHNPEAKVKCSQCEKTFVNKSYLKMHMLYHTGEKNFTCSICNSKYYKSSHLKRHIQNVHFKLRLMKCDFCPSDFVRKETYKSHIISHHKRQISDQQFEEILEKIKKFQPPSLDVTKYTLEKQTGEVGEIIDEVEMIEEDEMQGDDSETYFEETEIFEDEQ